MSHCALSHSQKTFLKPRKGEAGVRGCRSVYSPNKGSAEGSAPRDPHLDGPSSLPVLVLCDPAPRSSPLATRSKLSQSDSFTDFSLGAEFEVLDARQRWDVIFHPPRRVRNKESRCVRR